MTGMSHDGHVTRQACEIKWLCSSEN